MTTFFQTNRLYIRVFNLYNSQSMGELIKPNQFSEGLVSLPDRDIAVIGTDHGNGKLFPGKTQTEVGLARYFGYKGPDLLIIDSLPKLEEEQEFVNRSIRNLLQPNRSDFLIWAVNYAANNGSLLVGADPVVSEDFSQVTFNERMIRMIDNLDSGSLRASRNPLEDPFLRESAEDKLSWPLLASVTSLAIITGLYQAFLKRMPSRRQFLTLGLTAVIGSGVGMILNGDLNLLIKLFTPPSEMKRISYTTNRFGVMEVSDIESDENRRNRLMIEGEDYEEVEKLFVNPRELTEQDTEKGSFERISEINRKYFAYTLTLRNAIYAEVAAQPLGSLIPNRDLEFVRIAIISGANHLVLPTDSRISWFLRHEEERRELIETYTKALFEGIQIAQMQMRNLIDRDKLRESFMDLGKVYSINPLTGELQMYKFPIPVLEDTLKDV